jgi:hypothetical protein
MTTWPNGIFRTKILWLTVLLACSAIRVFAQEDVLGRIYDFRIKSQKLESVFDEISRQTGYYFIYDARLIDPDKQISAIKGPLTLRQYLEKCTDADRVDFKVINHHIIISRKALKVDASPKAVQSVDSSAFIILKGRIMDAESHQALAYASVSINYTTIGAVTNSEGRFLLKIDEGFSEHVLHVSHIGYKAINIPISGILKEDNVFLLQRDVVSLQEVVIRNQDPMKLLLNAQKKMRENYPQKPYSFTGYYREAARRNNSYYLIAEAVVQVYKPGQSSLFENEQVKVLKSRKTINPEVADTMVMRLKAGLNACFMLDLINNLPDFIKPGNQQSYNFEMADMVKINDETVYVVAFSQKNEIDEPLFCGKIFIDKKTYAILGAEFEITPGLIEKTKDEFIVRNKKRVNVSPQRIFYRVAYRPFGGVYYINHVRGEMDFKIRKTKRLFPANYHVFFEMATSSLDTVEIKKFNRKEVNNPQLIFSETKDAYDPNFWENNIIIEPETPFEKALQLINDRIRKSLTDK